MLDIPTEERMTCGASDVLLEKRNSSVIFEKHNKEFIKNIF